MAGIESKDQTLIYDGDCHICSSMAEKARARVLNERIRFMRSQDYDNTGDDKRVDPEALNKSVVYINDGIVYTGTDAVIGIVRQMPGLWKVIGFVISLPVVKQVFGLGYRLFARHRHSISGMISDSHPRRDP